MLTLEIVVRTGFMFLAALVLVRLLGKRGLGQISPFEYVIVFALGSATGDPMFYPEVPLLHGVVVLAVIVLLQKALLTGSNRSAAVQHFLQGVPRSIVQAGTVDNNALKEEGMSREELMTRLRGEGLTNVGQVQFAFLETSGKLSVFAYGDAPHSMGESTMTIPPASVGHGEKTRGG